MPIQNGKVLLSYSSFSVWSQCPYRYQQEKILRVKVKEDDLSYNVPGLIVHKAAEVFLESGSAELFDKSMVQVSLMQHASEPRVNLENAYGSFNKALEFTNRCANNLKDFLIMRKVREQQYYSEQWFGSWEDPLMFSQTLGTQGAADLAIQLPNNMGLLYDYKATWSDKNLNKDQLLLYSIALKLRFGINITMASFFLLPTAKHISFSFSKEQKVDLLRRMQTAADKILQGEFPKTPNEKCQRCPYYNQCEEGKHYEIEKAGKAELDGQFSPTFGFNL